MALGHPERVARWRTCAAPRFTAQGGCFIVPLGGPQGALLHNAGGMCAEGGEQGGEDGDDNLTDALQGVLRTFFHGK